MLSSSSLNDVKKYRPEIDGLRAIAIVSVVFYHAGFSGFSGGFVGVDVFFVISGYLITGLLFNEAMANGRISLSAFYARRVRRLMPAGLLVVAATLLLGGLFMSPSSDEQRSLARSAMAVAIFGSNFYFFKKTGDYFDDPSFSLPLLHTWSLSIEEQYYLIWPLLMLLLFRFSKVPHVEETLRRRVMFALWTMLLLSLALCVGATPNYQNFSFYLLPARIWEFAVGGIVGLASNAFHSRLRKYAEALALVGLALIVYSVTTLNHRTPFPGWSAVLPVFGTAALIVGMCANKHGLVRRLLSSRLPVFIGLLSYSWYLWHWPLLSIFRIHNLGIQNVGANALIVALALGLAWLTYIWIERPIRLYRPWLFAGVRSTLYVGLGIVLSTLLLAGGLWMWSNQQKSFNKARADVPPYKKTCSVSRTRSLGNMLRDQCIHGPDKAHPKVVLWGDSHAGHMLPMLMEAYPDKAVYQLTMAGCVPVIGYESYAPGMPELCPEFNQRVLQEILQLKNNGLESVVISARWPTYLWHTMISPAARPAGEELADAGKKSRARVQFQSSLDTLLSTLERNGLRVLLVAPTPELFFSAPQCVGMGRGAQCDVSRDINDSFVGDATAALAEVASRHPGTRLAQPMDFFCDTLSCYALRDNKFLFFDADHITATASRELSYFLSKDLAWLHHKP